MSNQEPLEDEEFVVNNDSPMMAAIKKWCREDGPYYATSAVAHIVVAISVLLILDLLGFGIVEFAKKEPPKFTADAVEETAPPAIAHMDFSQNNPDPPDPDANLLDDPTPLPAAVEEKHYDDSENFEEAGGGSSAMGTDLPGLGSEYFGASATGAASTGGIAAGQGTGTNAGSGGDGVGFGGRGEGHRAAMVGMYGGTKGTERAVQAALRWLAFHQSPDGSWSLQKFNNQCKQGKCDGAASHNADAAGTAMGLLPFLAAGQTHMGKGTYQPTVDKGIKWLISKQKPNGDLSAGASGNEHMYTHGLATIALCECYGLSEASNVRNAAQKAIEYIELAQDKTGGGWRYTPNEPGDTSVVGWCVMALKSGQMAGLKVKPESMTMAKKYLAAASQGKGKYGGLYGYMPGNGPTPAMTAVGLLCSQYMGAKKEDPGMTEGVGFFMGNMPDKGQRNLYYWYYATQVLHNVLGGDWDKWNRTMRRVLVDSQVKGDTKQSCAVGSWDPSKPMKDQWGEAGGRVMQTSLSCLTLEVYYRYLPLYKTNEQKKDKEPAKEPAKVADAKK